MARKTRRQRLEEQRIRQAELREAARENCRPDRDDLARMLLWLMIREAHDQAARQRSSVRLNDLCTLLVTNLARQGFDADEAEDVFGLLERKYKSQAAPGRIKRHLGRPARGYSSFDA